MNGLVYLAKIKPFVVTLFFLLLVSCVSSTPPYENFQNLNRRNIGRKVDDPSLVFMGWTNPKDLVKVVRLPNGHDEYHYIAGYKGQLTCRQIYEVDPKTLIIVGFRWEGTEKDCGIQP